MIDIAKVREDLKALHAEATAHEEEYAAEAATPEEQAKQDERFAALDRLNKSLENAQRLAKFSFSKEEPAPGVRAELPRKSADQVAVEMAVAKAAEPLDRQGYAAQLSAWLRGDEPESYAAITTASANGAMLPNIVKNSINLIAVNAWLASLSILGRTPASYGTTAKVTTPAVSPFAGSALAEDGSGETDANANAKLGSITTTPTGFQSGNFWYSGLEIGAVDYDITASHLPALAGASSRAWSVAIKTAIKADSAVTQSVTTATTSTITLANLDDLNNLLDPVYDSSKVIKLSKTAYVAAEKLQDSTGMPILSRDVQNQSLLRFKGTPVIKDTTLDAMGTSTNLVGLIVGYDGVEVRNETEKVLKYVNDPDRPDKTGVNHIRYAAIGYLPGAIGKLVN